VTLSDPELDEWVRQNGAGPASFDVVAVRAQARARGLARAREPRLERVQDLAIGTLPLRLYEPDGAGPQVIVFLHGGMWMLGDLETHDRTCRRLAEAAAARVLAVDFRRAPEHRWPAAVDDCEAAVRWASAELDARAPVLAGDSAGGHLALLVALRGVPTAGLLLACPNTDLRLATRSMRELGHGWGLNADSLRWAVDQWLPPATPRDDPTVNPLLADLAGLPATLVVTASHDPLRDEGDDLARALAEAGVPVVHRREQGMVHGFIQNLDLVSPAAGRATARWLDDARELVNAP
jgi:acetyl esterase